jgi:hypothetical protein
VRQQPDGEGLGLARGDGEGGTGVGQRGQQPGDAGYTLASSSAPAE